jgi:hypothetical protein
LTFSVPIVWVRPSAAKCLSQSIFDHARERWARTNGNSLEIDFGSETYAACTGARKLDFTYEFGAPDYKHNVVRELQNYYWEKGTDKDAALVS